MKPLSHIRTILICLFPLFFIACEQDLDLSSEEVTNALPGMWLCKETQFKHAYEVRLVKSTYRSNAIIIYNFYDLGELSQIETRIDGYTISIFQQSFSNDYTAKGTGVVSDDLNEIRWSYEVDDGTGLIERYDAVYTKLD